MDRIRIPNEATYTPLPLLDVALAAPLISRLLFRATLPGKALQMAAMGVYIGSAAKDWIGRRGIRRIDFMAEFGADIDHLEPMPVAERRREVEILVERGNQEYTAERIPLAQLAVLVDEHLTQFIAGITGQRVETSTEIRGFTMAHLVFPFALGACDILSGDVAIFHDTGVFEPHVVAHEFTHRKGYWKELDAQAISYLAMASSGHPILVQSARCERLHRQLRVLSGDDDALFRSLLEESGLRAELAVQFSGLRTKGGPIQEKVEEVMKIVYDGRMKITGQNGIRDYDVGFTNFLYTFERTATARQRSPEPFVNDQ
jgi:hypothetical protein